MNLTQLGLLAVERGDHQEAVNIFKRALEQKKEPDAYFGFGVAHFHLGDLPTARWAFYQVLERNRDHKEAQRYIARIEQTKRRKPDPVRRSSFRALRDHLEVHDGRWRRFFVKGVNIGLGLPGYFPGEFAVKKGTYQKWFNQISELGANAVRVYTILPPDFYEALSEFNSAEKKLYLFQEIWTELPERNDFEGRRFLEGLTNEIRNAVDSIYGNAVLPERPGHAHGRYVYDVSPYLAGFIIGREWEACAVKGFNELHQRRKRDFAGAFLRILQGNPFEVWITRTCDFLQSYEYEKYRVSHPVTTVNWATLDPIKHPSESTYEDEYRLQGLTPQGGEGTCIDVHIEDTESLDLSKIVSVKGNGFFALYHAYPYYPDFMNHDYLEQENTYLAYLTELKQHHGRQPVIVGEFGVPSSRESAHWHRDGWHHGGHSDQEQGKIDGILMKSIHKAGMAGGILFSLFDEWFKKNWLFMPGEYPPDRKPLWYNMQDPEENYGLLAAYPGYPGKKVNLACRTEDWRDVPALYEKKRDAMAYRFRDGSDDARRLERLFVQHDEGFLYLLLVTSGAIDFSRVNFLVGLDTCSSNTGERLLPFGTNIMSPIGLTFLIQLAGTEHSRILAAGSYDKYLNGRKGVIRPEASDQGAWVMMLNETNIRRISKDGKRFYPPRSATMSRLRFGSLDTNSAKYHSLADFFYRENRLELRIPWGLINVTDPSSQMVLWMEQGRMARQTPGIRIFVVSYRPEEGRPTAYGTGRAWNHTDCLPLELSAAQIKTYSWDRWDTPLFHTYVKKSYYHVQKIFRTISEGS